MNLDHDEKDAKGELLPCPFCGGPAHLSSAGGWHAVGCAGAQTCPAYLRAQTHRTEASAVATWNGRHVPSGAVDLDPFGFLVMVDAQAARSTQPGAGEKL